MLNVLTWVGSWLAGSPYTKWIFLILLVLAGAAYAWHLAYNKGKTDVEIKGAVRTIEILSKKVKSDAEIVSMSRADRRERMRKWVVDPE